MINQDNNIESSPTKDGKKCSLFDELFLLQKISTIDHNTKKSSSPQNTAIEYSPSQLTKALLQKIKQHRDEPWKLLNNISELIEQLIKHLPQKYYKPNEKDKVKYICEGSVHFINDLQIYIGQQTTIQHGTVIIGPCIVGRNCQIRKGAYIRGNVIMGDGCLLGNSCQVKNSIFMDRCQIAHFNYVGDSILGIHAHFAAGSIISNYKLDGSLIKIQKRVEQKKMFDKADNKKNPDNEIITTERNKLGAIVGNNTQIGCNSVLNPGSIIGRNCVIYPLINWKGYLGANQICKLRQQQILVEKI